MLPAFYPPSPHVHPAPGSRPTRCPPFTPHLPLNQAVGGLWAEAREVSRDDKVPLPHTLPFTHLALHTAPHRGEMMQSFFPQMIDQDSNSLVPMLASVGTQAV